MLRKKKRLFSRDDEIDPMIYAVNMVDCMLVLAVGFLIFTVISMNLQAVIFDDMTPQEKMEVSQLIKQTVQISMGQELNSTPEIQTGSSGGYVQTGVVYTDPTTGKLIMVKGNGTG